jgi:ABC-type lipoprotein release transport system permease subunit
MIGVLKALGSSNGGIRRIFLIDAAYILGIGIVLGDLLGIALCLVIQKTFEDHPACRWRPIMWTWSIDLHLDWQPICY